MISRITTVGDSIPKPNRLVWESAERSLVFTFLFMTAASHFRSVTDRNH